MCIHMCFKYFMHMCVYLSVYVWTTFVPGVSRGQKHQIPSNWSYSCLWVITKARVSLSKPGPAVHTQLIVWVVAVCSATCGVESCVSIYKSTVCRGIPFSTLVLKSHIACLCITLTTLVTVTVCSICIWSSSGLTGISSSPENWEIFLQQSAQSIVFTWPGASPVTWWPVTWWR